MTDQSDEEIGKRILARFPRAFSLGPQDKLKEKFVETRGKHSGFWHPLAIAYVEEREADEISINQACREFLQILEDKYNYHVTLGTVSDVIRSKRGRPFRYISGKQFLTAVLDNDLDAAIKWFKHLSPKERKRWGFE